MSVEHKKYNGGIDGLKKRSMGLKRELKVGILKGTGTHPNSESALIAEIAFWNEFGVLQAIPARPFMRQTLDANRAKYSKLQAELIAKLLLGKINTNQFYSIFGMTVKKDIQNEIRNGSFEANAESTIAMKGGKSKPLIDTGLLRQSINYTSE